MLLELSVPKLFEVVNQLSFGDTCLVVGLVWSVHLLNTTGSIIMPGLDMCSIIWLEDSIDQNYIFQVIMPLHFQYITQPIISNLEIISWLSYKYFWLAVLKG